MVFTEGGNSAIFVNGWTLGWTLGRCFFSFSFCLWDWERGICCEFVCFNGVKYKYDIVVLYNKILICWGENLFIYVNYSELCKKWRKIACLWRLNAVLGGWARTYI